MLFILIDYTRWNFQQPLGLAIYNPSNVKLLAKPSGEYLLFSITIIPCNICAFEFHIFTSDFDAFKIEWTIYSRVLKTFWKVYLLSLKHFEGDMVTAVYSIGLKTAIGVHGLYPVRAKISHVHIPIGAVKWSHEMRAGTVSKMQTILFSTKLIFSECNIVQNTFTLNIAATKCRRSLTVNDLNTLDIYKW